MRTFKGLPKWSFLTKKAIFSSVREAKPNLLLNSVVSILTSCRLRLLLIIQEWPSQLKTMYQKACRPSHCFPRRLRSMLKDARRSLTLENITSLIIYMQRHHNKMRKSEPRLKKYSLSNNWITRQPSNLSLITMPQQVRFLMVISVSTYTPASNTANMQEKINQKEMVILNRRKKNVVSHLTSMTLAHTCPDLTST